MIATRERLSELSTSRTSTDDLLPARQTMLAPASEPLPQTEATKSTNQGSWRKRLAAFMAQPIEYIPCEEFATCDAEDTALPESLTGDGWLPLDVKKRVATDLGTPLARACEARLLTAAEERALFRRMNYLKFRAARIGEWLSPQTVDEAALTEAQACLAEAEELRNRIVSANVRLVISIVKTFSDLKNPFDELVSDGILSMMHAVSKFDFDRGFRFSTYATRAIRRNLYRLMVQRQKDRSRFHTPSSDLSLEVTDERGGSAISENRWHELQGHLKRMLKALDPRERMIVRARFGMDKTGKVQTLQAIAKTLGVCKERVRQLEKRAIDKLQKMVGDIPLEEPSV
jgi:RNA polymerase primary sigma factor